MVLGEGTLPLPLKRWGGGGEAGGRCTIFHAGLRHPRGVNASTIGGSAQGVGAPLAKPPAHPPPPPPHPHPPTPPTYGDLENESCADGKADDQHAYTMQ